MVLYLLICLASVLAGCGIMALIGVEVNRATTLPLSPVVTLCFVSVLLGGLVAGGLTVGQVTPFVFLLCAGIAAFGALKHGKTILAGWPGLLLLMVLPLLLMRPLLHDGFENYSGGMDMDGWGYVTGGQALQKYSMGAEGWLPVHVQYVSQFQKATRFMSYAFLALLAPLSGAHADCQDAYSRYIGWLFFVYSSACSFLAKAARFRRPLAWTFVCLAVLSGWMLRLVSANNVDNTLALCFVPAALGIFMLMPRPSVGHGIVLGGIVSAGLYAYPESAPFTLAAMAASLAQRIIAAPRPLQAVREFRHMALAFLATIAICIAPYATTIVSFYKIQVQLGTQPVGTRPGEGLYPSLFNLHYALPNFWGLTPDFWFNKYSGRLDPYATAMACILTIAALAGMFILLRRREWSVPLFFTGMTAAYIFCLIRLHYSYAASKFGVLERFATVYLVVVALTWLCEALQRRSPKWAHASAGLASVVIAVMGIFFVLEQKIMARTLVFPSVKEFRKVSVLEHIASGQPVAMIVRETYANIWATHFLRDTRLYLAGQYRGYMDQSAPMVRSEPVDAASIRYFVTDSEDSFRKEFLMSHEGPYYIWDLGQNPWTFMTEVDNSVGLPVSESSLWIAAADSDLQILSRSATTATISGNFTIAGAPPGTGRERVTIRNLTGCQEEIVLTAGMNSFSVPLQPGLNNVYLRSAETSPFTLHSEHVSVSADQNTQAVNCPAQNPK